MEKEKQTGQGIQCIVCKKTVLSYLNIYGAVYYTTEKDYRSNSHNGLGIYCVNCDHAICVTCLTQLNNITDIADEIQRGLLSYVDNWNSRNPQELNRYIILKCPLCKTFYGNLQKQNMNHVVEIIKEGNKKTLDEIGAGIKDLQTVIARLDKHNLLKERVNVYLQSLEVIIQGALPRLGIEIQKCLNESRFDDALALCNRGVLWVSLLKEKGDLLKNLQTMIEAIEKLKSPTIEISAEGIRAAFEKMQQGK